MPRYATMSCERITTRCGMTTEEHTTSVVQYMQLQPGRTEIVRRNDVQRGVRWRRCGGELSRYTRRIHGARTTRFGVQEPLYASGYNGVRQQECYVVEPRSLRTRNTRAVCTRHASLYMVKCAARHVFWRTGVVQAGEYTNERAVEASVRYRTVGDENQRSGVMAGERRQSAAGRTRERLSGQKGLLGHQQHHQSPPTFQQSQVRVVCSKTSQPGRGGGVCACARVWGGRGGGRWGPRTRLHRIQNQRPPGRIVTVRNVRHEPYHSSNATTVHRHGCIQRSRVGTTRYTRQVVGQS